MSWWPLPRSRSKPSSQSGKGRRLAAYLWRFPTLSETFIRRELCALASQGYEVFVFADGPADLGMADAEARALLPFTEYVHPMDPERLTAYRRRFLRHHPVSYLTVMLYILFHRYDYWKTLTEDRHVFRSVVYLAGRLQDKDIDHLHAPWADRLAFMAVVAARLAGISCTMQARAHELHRLPMRYALREKFTEADAVITNCDYNQSHIRETVGDSAGLKLHRIYEGVIPEKFMPREDWALSSPINILCVARIDEQKGLQVLLEACAALRDAGMTFCCDIIGGAEPNHAAYRLYIEKLHKKLGLGDSVRFLGAQASDQVIDALNRADLFVLPCVIANDGSRDITPNVLFEAMAMQLPVVSTRLSGIPEIVEHGVSGLLVPPGDADALQQAIMKFANDAELREEMGRNARIRVQDRFDLRRNISEFTALFETLAS